MKYGVVKYPKSIINGFNFYSELCSNFLKRKLYPYCYSVAITLNL